MINNKFFRPVLQPFAALFSDIRNIVLIESALSDCSTEKKDTSIVISGEKQR
jgi:hypothetical protein